MRLLSLWLQVQLILRILGLYNAKDTIVGNNDLRGVSGGERRRVTLGEETRLSHLLSPSIRKLVSCHQLAVLVQLVDVAAR